MLFTIQAPSIDPLRIEDVCHVKSQRLALNDTSTDTSKWNRHPGMILLRLNLVIKQSHIESRQHVCFYMQVGLFLDGCLCPLSNQFIVPTTHHLTVYTYIHTCMHACMHTYIHTYIYDYICIYTYICHNYYIYILHNLYNMRIVAGISTRIGKAVSWFFALSAL